MPLSPLYALLASLGLPLQGDLPPPAPSATKTVETCLKTCSVSDGGYSLVREFEGYMPFPYYDIAGIQTVGYGYVLRPGDKITYPLLPEQADELLRKTMGRFERDINHAVVVTLAQYQFDALGSWTYNLGAGALRSSTMLKRVNAQRHADVPTEIRKWDKARIDGTLQPVAALISRRAREAALYAGQ